MFYYIVYFNNYKEVKIFNTYCDAKRFCDTCYNVNTLIIKSQNNEEE